MSKAYKNVVFNNKTLDKAAKISDNDNVETVEKVMATIKKEDGFNPSLNAYVPYFNEETKKYELFTVAIDPSNNKIELLRKELPHDNMNRAMMEMHSMYAADHIQRLRDEKQKRKGIT